MVSVKIEDFHTGVLYFCANEKYKFSVAETYKTSPQL